MDTVPLLMRTIRHEMRRQRPAEISMPQFRALRILEHHPESSLSQMAQCLDLTLATTSKLMDVLEKHDLVSRVGCPTDRRKIMLTLSAHGMATLAQMRLATETRMAEVLARLGADDRASVEQAMRALRAAVQSEEQG
jgi:DNA-binding MarR family transcriptional regulator